MRLFGLKERTSPTFTSSLWPARYLTADNAKNSRTSRSVIQFGARRAVSAERRVGDGEACVVIGETDAGEAEEGAELFGGHVLQGAGRGRCAGRGLWVGGRARGVEGDVAFDLLHDLGDVAVQDCDRGEAPELRERLRGVRSRPAPLRVDAPQRYVRVDDDGRAGGESGQVSLKPRELLRAEVAEALAPAHDDRAGRRAGRRAEDVVQSDEGDAAVVEAAPAAPLRALAEASEELRAVVCENVVLAGDVEDLAGPRALQDLRQRVELFGLREVCEIARVQEEGGRLRERVDLVNHFLERARDVLVRLLLEADVRVAQLHEGERAARAGERVSAAGRQRPAAQSPDDGSAGPRHALEKAAPRCSVFALEQITHVYPPVRLT